VPAQSVKPASQCCFASIGKTKRGTPSTAKPSNANTKAANRNKEFHATTPARNTAPPPIATNATQYAEARPPWAAPSSARSTKPTEYESMATSCVADKVVSARINKSTITPTPAISTNGNMNSTAAIPSMQASTQKRRSPKRCTSGDQKNLSE